MLGAKYETDDHESQYLDPEIVVWKLKTMRILSGILSPLGFFRCFCEPQNFQFRKTKSAG